MKNKICAMLFVLLVMVSSNSYSDYVTKEEYETRVSRLNKLLAMELGYSSVEEFLQYEMVDYNTFHSAIFYNKNISSIPFSKGDIIHVPQETAVDRYHEERASDGKHLYLMTVFEKTGNKDSDTGYGVFYLESDEKLGTTGYHYPADTYDIYGYHQRGYKSYISDSFYMEYIGDTTYMEGNVSKHCWAFRLIKNLGHYSN